MNNAYVFIKPHANTEKTKELVAKTFADKGIKILEEGEIKAEVIDEKKLIDQHYYAIASKATILKPHELPVPADKFEAHFGVGWQAALDSGKVYNAMDACKYLELDAFQLEAEWRKIKKELIKFGGGFYCGLVNTVPDKEPIYVFNAFFMSMRAAFVEPGTSIYFYTVEFDPATMPWSDFRGKVLGPTNPADAPADSLRGLIMKDWESLGLKAEPDTGNNGVHASASPFEGLAERMNWLGKECKSDPFGAALLEAGVPQDTINAWSIDPQVAGFGSLFDSMEDLDAPACIAKAKEILEKSA